MNNNQIRTHVRTTQPKLRCSRVVGALGGLLLRLLGEPRQPFGKFIAAGQSQPAMLHVKIILDLRWAQGSFRLPLAPPHGEGTHDRRQRLLEVAGFYRSLAGIIPAMPTRCKTAAPSLAGGARPGAPWPPGRSAAGDA